MTTNLSNGRWVLSSAIFLSCSFLSLSVNGQYSVFAIKNVGPQSTFVDGYLDYQIDNGYGYGGNNHVVVQRTMASGQLYDVQVQYWGGMSTNAQIAWQWTQNAPFGANEPNPTYRHGSYHNDAETIRETVELWGQSIWHWLPVRIVNDTGWSILYSVSTQAWPPGSSGWVLAAPGATIEACVGPYTNYLGNWWVAVYDKNLVAGDGMWTASNQSNVVYMGLSPSGWNLGCSNYTTVHLSGRWSQTPGSTNVSETAGGRIDWHGGETNTSWVNTNLPVTTAIQIGSQAIVDTLRGLTNYGVGGVGGGTTVVTNVVGFGEITNQLNELTNRIQPIALWSSNAWRIVTNNGQMSWAGDVSTWSNTVIGMAYSGSNTVYTGVKSIGDKAIYSQPSISDDRPEISWEFKGMNGVTFPWTLPMNGGSAVPTWSNAVFPTWAGSTIRAILAAFMIIYLWQYIVKDATDQFKWLLHTGQTSAMKGQILGTSVALPISISVAIIVLALIFAVPVLLVALAETVMVSQFGTLSSAVASVVGQAPGVGIWGFLLDLVPVTTMFATGLAGVTWFAASNAIVCAVASINKAFITD